MIALLYLKKYSKPPLPLKYIYFSAKIEPGSISLPLPTNRNPLPPNQIFFVSR